MYVISLAAATILSIPPKITVEEDILSYLQVCATLSVNDKIAKNITIMLASTNDKTSALAMGGFDYELLQKTITFASGSMNGDEECIRIKLLNDTIVEETEVFVLIWATRDRRVMLQRNLTVITIIDNDG